MNKHNFSNLDHLQLVAKRLSDAGVDITFHYGDWVNVTFACASLGEGAREAYHAICAQYPGYSREECDEKFNNCLKTGRGDVSLATIMKLAKDHGIDTRLPRGRRPKSEQERSEEEKNKMLRMAELLHGFASFRFNELKQQVELSEKDEPWHPITDRDFRTYYCRVKEAGVKVGQADVQAMIESRDFSPEFNPLTSYLESLPPYDPERDGNPLKDMFVDHMEFGDPENYAFYDMVFQKWFVGMVALWTGQVNENPLMPVLCGPQHIGKTYFIRHILPPQLRHYVMEPAPSQPVDKDFIISISEVPLIFLDEFSITSNTKSDAYKFIITSSQSNLRDAYGRFRQTRQRKASLIAATNLDHFIRDAEGNRRYAAVSLVGTKNLDEYPIDYDRAFAQALWLLEQGCSPKPDHHESMVISEHNIPFMEPNDCEEALRVFLRKPRPNEQAEWLTSGDLMQELGNRGFRGRQFNAVEIGKAMKRLEFECKIKDGKKRYKLIIAEYERQKRERVSFAQDIDNQSF